MGNVQPCEDLCTNNWINMKWSVNLRGNNLWG